MQGGPIRLNSPLSGPSIQGPSLVSFPAHAETGILTRPELAASFAQASQASAAPPAVPQSRSFLDSVIASAKSTVQIRRVDDVEPSAGPDVAAAPADMDLKEGDLAAAVKKVEALPAPQREAFVSLARQCQSAPRRRCDLDRARNHAPCRDKRGEERSETLIPCSASSSLSSASSLRPWRLPGSPTARVRSPSIGWAIRSRRPPLSAPLCWRAWSRHSCSPGRCFVISSAVPQPWPSHFRERRRRQGFDALTHGLLAIGVGDRQLAQRYANIARRSLPDEPLTALLKAQAAQLKGDRAAARRSFEAMLEQPETELLGLRGLFLEAKRGNDTAAARALAEQAVRRDPKLAWSVSALFDMQTREGDWKGALDTLAIARKNGTIEPDVAVRRRAVLLTAEARELEAPAPDKALALAMEALRLAPSLIPAAEISGRILASRGETRQASRLVARTWKLAPHPDLALVYAYAKPGEAPRERLKRVKTLASSTPDDIEGRVAIAVAAIEAHEWNEAEAALAPDLDGRPPARVCALMARIEAGEGNKGREREWLARAVRAPRDRAWIADGYVSDRWLPVSPVTGLVDAFEWKAPVDAIGKGDDSLLIEEHREQQDEPPEPARPAIQAPPPKQPEPSKPTVVVTVPQPAPKAEVSVARQVASEPERPRGPVPTSSPRVFVPPAAPDDPGIAEADPDESPASLERLRAAQIR